MEIRKIVIFSMNKKRFVEGLALAGALGVGAAGVSEKFRTSANKMERSAAAASVKGERRESRDTNPAAPPQETAPKSMEEKTEDASKPSPEFDFEDYETEAQFAKKVPPEFVDSFVAYLPAHVRPPREDRDKKKYQYHFESPPQQRQWGKVDMFIQLPDGQQYYFATIGLTSKTRGTVDYLEPVSGAWKLLLKFRHKGDFDGFDWDMLHDDKVIERRKAVLAQAKADNPNFGVEPPIMQAKK